ncbi:hypothetical protein Cni_G26186 [Canna indica]|uniref:AP2/ERF domain-containing protein n=1 Tax=Canna indica TaxID=4628 RepID=A0AAQ3KZ62_9LILI|nr:hypothetical protein Cni_G26186 [Canna indica]
MPIAAHGGLLQPSPQLEERKLPCCPSPLHEAHRAAALTLEVGEDFLRRQEATLGKWVAEICLPCNRTRLSLGTFLNAEEAALTYNKAAFKVHSDDARLNFPKLHHGGAHMALPLHPFVGAKLQSSARP